MIAPNPGTPIAIAERPINATASHQSEKVINHHA
jgi:hypothetical protein